MIGGGYGVGAQHGDPQRSAFQQNREDIDRVIVLNRLCDLSQIGGETLAVKFPYQHFGEPYFGRGAAGSAAGPIRRVVDGEGSFIEIALELEIRSRWMKRS